MSIMKSTDEKYFLFSMNRVIIFIAQKKKKKANLFNEGQDLITQN